MPGGIIRHYYPICPNIRDTGTVVSRRATRCGIYQDIGLSSFLFPDIIMLHKTMIYYQNDS